jgi:hypothetical protein
MRGLLKVFHSQCDSGTDGYLGTNDTISIEEAWRENVHRSTLSLGHADLVAEKLTDDTSDSATTKDSKRMAAVGSDNHIFLGYGRLKTN